MTTNGPPPQHLMPMLAPSDPFPLVSALPTALVDTLAMSLIRPVMSALLGVKHAMALSSETVLSATHVNHLLN
jgi:hypothetical protein